MSDEIKRYRADIGVRIEDVVLAADHDRVVAELEDRLKDAGILKVVADLDATHQRISELEMEIEEHVTKRELATLQALINAQNEDDGLWFVPQYATEDYLQRALRKLHNAIYDIMVYENEPQP